MKQNLANLLTLTRICLALLLPRTDPASAGFWLLYYFCGVSDAMDGWLARKLRQVSALGSMLDSIADAVFFLSAAAVFLRCVDIPTWLWLCAILALLLRLTSYGVGFLKHHSFVSVHTCGNKAAGALLFTSPALYQTAGLTATGIVVGAAAILSAVEELIINLRSRTPERDRRTLLTRRQHHLGKDWKSNGTDQIDARKH